MATEKVTNDAKSIARKLKLASTPKSPKPAADPKKPATGTAKRTASSPSSSKVKKQKTVCLASPPLATATATPADDTNGRLGILSSAAESAEDN